MANLPNETDAQRERLASIGAADVETTLARVAALELPGETLDGAGERFEVSAEVTRALLEATLST